jgi:two-component system, NarL family, sensor histidine kinase UhpB
VQAKSKTHSELISEIGMIRRRSKTLENKLKCLTWDRAELKAIYGNAPVFLCVLDKNRRVLYANRAFCKFTGVPQKELQDGRACGVFGCINALDDPRGCGFGPQCIDCKLRLAIEDSFRSGRSHKNIEYRAVLERKGVRQTIVLLGSTVRFSFGKRSRLLLCMQDITENKRAEDRYRTVVEDQTEVICRFKADGTLTFVNEVYCRFFGKNRRQLLGSKWQPLAVTEDLPMIQNRLRMLTPSNPIIIIENRVYSETGKVYWMQFSNRGFFASNGRLDEIQSVGRDISERKNTEQALRESEARFRAIFEHSMPGILLTAPDGRVFAANPAACRLLGRTEESICKLGRAGIIDKKDSRIRPLLQERAEKGYAAGELNFIRENARRIPVYVNSAIFETHEGLRTCMILQDLSEIRGAEKRIRSFSQRLLAVREEEKSRLSALLHHEIGSIAVGIAAHLNAAEADLRKKDFARAVDSIKKCRRLFIQSAKRFRNAAIELRPPDLDILGLRTALRQHFLRIGSKASLKIRFTDRTGELRISPDVQTFLFRTAQECLNNIIKHARARHVWLNLSVAAGQVRLSARDNGKGFDVNRFMTGPGMHLGLRAIHEMAAALGGSFDIASKPGGGTKLIVRVPVSGID